MKMVKKILLGLTAAAALMTLVSCGTREEAGNKDLIDVNAGSSSASIDYKNDGDAVTRGFRSLQTKHLDAICQIDMEITDFVTGKNAVSSGSMGYIFNIVKGAEDKYSFTIAALRYNQTDGTVQAYVESFKDVAKDSLEKELTGGVKAANLPSYSGYGFTLLNKSQTDALLAATPKKLTFWIDVVANDGTTEGRKGTAGTYTVSIYTADPGRNSSATSYELTYADKSKMVGQCVIPVANVNAPYDATKGLTSMQSDVGFYANVYTGQTLKGKWKFSQIKKEAEEIE